MCGIFAYLNYNVSRERRYILEVLFNGLRRLEYRGYDSSGIALDADRTAPTSSASPSDAPYAGAPPLVFRQEGKIENLVRSVYSGQFSFDFFFFCFCPLKPSVPECFLAQSGFWLLHAVKASILTGFQVIIPGQFSCLVLQFWIILLFLFRIVTLE